MTWSALALDLGLVTLVGGLVSLDRKGAFQTMISQPLVVVPALGLLLGDLSSALWMGAMLQLLWISSLQVGANVPPNETIASAAIGGMALLFGKHVEPLTLPIMTVAILLGAPLAHLARWVDIRADKANLALARQADKAAEAGRPARITGVLVLGLARTFASSILILAPSIALGVTALYWTAQQLTPPFIRGLEAFGLYVIPALGLAVGLSALRRRRALVVAAACFAVVFTAIRYGEIL